MAYFRTDDLRATSDQLAKMGRPMIRKIVEAGAGAAERVMREATEMAGHVRTGDLMNSISPGQYREYLGGGAQEVYPQGDNRNGERLQTIAWVINYGRGGSGRRNRDGSRSKMGDKFMTRVEADGEKAALEAMQAESDALMAAIGAE